MFDGNSSDDPNPFAFAAETGRKSKAGGSSRRKALFSALKFLLIIAIGLSITLVIGNQSQVWLVKRLTSDFETLSATEKRHRLSQLSALGLPGIRPMVGVLCDEYDDVARAAYDLLRIQQNDWALLDRDEAVDRHAALVDAMNSIVQQISDDRTTWTTSLLQQSIAISVNRGDESSKHLYTAATNMLDRMSLSQRSGPSILVDEADDFPRSRQLVVRSRPLPVSPSESIDDWTDWPPHESQPPTVYRSSATKLQPVASPQDVQLTDVDESQSNNVADFVTDDAAQPLVVSPEVQPINATIDSVETDVRPAGMLVDSPLETYDTKSVIYWLGNSHEPLRVAAKNELMRRGLSRDEITIATRIAAGDLQTKLDLVDVIARNGSIDPRPWLLLLLSDPSRDVKLKTVSVLATINDPAVEQELRNHILGEPDPTVAFRIRKLLDLR